MHVLNMDHMISISRVCPRRSQLCFYLYIIPNPNPSPLPLLPLPPLPPAHYMPYAIYRQAHAHHSADSDALSSTDSTPLFVSQICTVLYVCM